MMRRVETMEGSGRVTKADGTLVGDRAYHVERWREFIDDGRGGEIPGMFSVRGSVALEGYEGFALVGIDLVLELEDGRTLPFFFENSHGAIAPRGDFK